MDNQNNRNKQNLPGNNNPNNKNNRQRWNIILFTVMLISFIVFALYQFREDTEMVLPLLCRGRKRQSCSERMRWNRKQKWN